MEEQEKITNILDREVGEDKPQLEAKKVKVKEIKVDVVTFRKEAKEITKTKVKLMCEHPDSKDKQIELSGVKYEVSDKIKVSALWGDSLDSDGKTPYNSALAIMLRFYKCKTLNDMVNKEIDTTVNDEGYLLVKAY